MGKIFAAMAASVDGFISGRDTGPGQGLGVGGEVLHDWYFNGDSPSAVSSMLMMSSVSRDYVDRFAGNTGAVIVGRQTYEDSEHWGGDRPHPTAELFVLSRRAAPPDATPIQHFVGTLEEAVAAAREAACEKDINLMGGEVVTAALAAGYVDEIVVHQVPVLLGGGRRFFDELPDQVRLSLVEVVQAPGVLHLHYRVER